MTWRYIDPLLEKAARHSTIFGKYWATIIVIFRLTMLTFAERAWSDEQKEFRCNTKEVGRAAILFLTFSSKVTYYLSPLILRKMAERSEAKSAKQI